VLGLTVNQLIEQWRDDVQKQYLPEIKDRVKARVVASPVLTEERSEGRLHVAPALSPDGSKIAYLSEKDFFFIDLYLADAISGKVKRRLVKSTFDPNFRTLRFLKASMSWSPDGQFLAITAGRKAQDDIVILNGENGKEVGRIKVDLNGITNPSWSPDGSQLVFTGYDGGISDLYLVGRDGSGLRKLTDDKYANLQPVWSPDGKTIAFVTDRGPDTDFSSLAFGNFRLALFHLDSGTEEVLEHMDTGKNMSPQWGPEGRTIAFVSDRSGVSNIFLYDFEDVLIYKLTNFYTGTESITPESPALSWAAGADRLAFVYYEKNNFDVYTLEQPRSLKQEPFQLEAEDDVGIPVLAAALDAAAAQADQETPSKDQPQVLEGGTVYRTPRGFRAGDQVVEGVDSIPDAAAPISIATLLDSVSLSLPDTSEFSIGKYRAKLTPDYISRPSIGYSRDTFGNGFFGGSAIVLSDMLNNHQLAIAAFLNGRIKEAQVFVGFANLSRRLNWQVGVSQDPVFFAELDELRTDDPEPGVSTFVTNVRRLIVRRAFARGFYPLNTFRRVELSLQLVNIEDDILALEEQFNPSTGLLTAQPQIVERDLGSTNYVQPSVAMVFDNTLFGWTAPFMGQRYRLELSRTIGGWDFTQGTFDYRRYDRLAGPIVLATRALYFGRMGRDADRFNVFLGSPELLRGNTSGSYYRNECSSLSDLGTETGCVALDRMLGTQIAVASAELRFPILTPDLGFAPRGFPPIEGALFYDVGMAWNEGSTLKFSREAGDDALRVRTPLSTAGLALRMNFFNFLILRADWNFPLDRDIGNYWTLSLGPAF
jgi:Tol biopolymer transport system component